MSPYPPEGLPGTPPETAPEQPSAPVQRPEPSEVALGDTLEILGRDTPGKRPRDHHDPQCPGRKVIWHQAGNRTGHCSGCHCTFDSLAAFERHRCDGACLYPGDITDSTGRKLYERRDVDLWADTHDAGTTYWRLTLTDQQAERFDRLHAEHTEAAS